MGSMAQSPVSRGRRPLARSGVRNTRKVWMRETTIKGRFAVFFGGEPCFAAAIQARVDSGHSVLAPSCKYELALVGRSINGSSLGHGHARFRLLTHTPLARRCQRVTNSSAPLPSGLQAGRQSHLPMSLLPDKVRRKFRYKRVGALEEFPPPLADLAAVLGPRESSVGLN